MDLLLPKDDCALRFWRERIRDGVERGLGEIVGSVNRKFVLSTMKNSKGRSFKKDVSRRVQIRPS